MKKKLYGIIILFLLLPWFLDKFIMGKIVTTMNQSEWFGFLGSYLGGGITALITLYGIYWQLKVTESKDKKNKLEGIFMYINYILNKKIEFNYEILSDSIENQSVTELFKNIKSSLVEENIKDIFSRREGIMIAELIEEIADYNKDYLRYLTEYMKIENKVGKLINIIEKSKLDIHTKRKWTTSLLKGKNIILLLNTHNNFVRLIIDNQKVRLNELERIRELYQRDVFDMINFLKNEFLDVFDGTEIQIKNEYDDLINLSELYESKINDIKYEEYLIKLFTLEEKIFYISKLLLIDIRMGNENLINFCKELEKISVYFKTKINLLKRKNDILKKISMKTIVIDSIIKDINRM